MEAGSSSSPPNEQGRILKRYLTRWSYLSAHLSVPSSGPLFTYENDAHGSTSIIDHLLCPTLFISAIKSCYVLTDHHLNLSDHRAIFASIVCTPPSMPSISTGQSFPAPKSHLDWSKLDLDTIMATYSVGIDTLLATFPSSTVISADAVDDLFSSLSDILIIAAQDHIPSHTLSRLSIGRRWTPVIKDAQSLSKSKYREWVAGGKPMDPSHPLKKAYKDAKRAFRRQFRLLNREDTDNFFKSLDPSDSNVFRAVRQKLGSKPITSDRLVVQGITYSDAGILEGWARYFETLYSPSPQLYDFSHFHYIHDSVQKVFYLFNNSINTITISPEDVVAAISVLPKKKASGPDLITMEHLIFSPSSLSVHLADLFSAILHLHHVPSSFCTSTIIPLFKGEY